MFGLLGLDGLAVRLVAANGQCWQSGGVAEDHIPPSVDVAVTGVLLALYAVILGGVGWAIKSWFF